MQRRYLKMGVSAVFTIGFIVFLVHLTCIFCVIGDSALCLLFPSIHCVLQNKQWKAVLRLSLQRRTLVNISRITCGITFWNCSFSSRLAA